MSLPRILVTPDYEDGPAPRYFLKRAYPDAVAAAGGLPLVVAYGVPVAALLAGADGLLVTGGAFDIPPEDYGEERAAACGPEKRERTRFETELLVGALAAGLPVLGVCGGMQLLNVVRGGTLFQDVTSELPGAGPHEQQSPRHEPAHGLAVEPGSRVAAAAAGASELAVNTTHHQAVRRPGAGLSITARAPDGVVEAIEDPSAPFVVGVQWHPELLAGHPWNARLYDAFVAAARGPR